MLCGAQSAPGVSARRLVIETRTHEHPRREKAMVYYEHRAPGLKPRKKWRADPGGIGSQIVREAKVCAACYARGQTSK